MAAVSSSLKLFQLKKNSFARHYTVEDGQDKQLFYVDLSTMTANKPDLTMHQGINTSSPVIAVSHMPKFSGNLKIGLGDPSESDNVLWEDLTREGLSASVYRFAMTLPDGQRLQFVWKRTKSVAVDGTSIRSLSIRNYKLVNEATGDVAAVFTSKRTYTKCGDLQINADFGSDFDNMVMITCISLYEKARRRARRGAAGGGGGGGG